MSADRMLTPQELAQKRTEEQYLNKLRGMTEDQIATALIQKGIFIQDAQILAGIYKGKTQEEVAQQRGLTVDVVKYVMQKYPI